MHNVAGVTNIDLCILRRPLYYDRTEDPLSNLITRSWKGQKLPDLIVSGQYRIQRATAHASRGEDFRRCLAPSRTLCTDNVSHKEKIRSRSRMSGIAFSAGDVGGGHVADRCTTQSIYRELSIKYWQTTNLESRSREELNDSVKQLAGAKHPVQDTSWAVERMRRKKAAFVEIAIQVDSINTRGDKIKDLGEHCIIRDG